MATTTTTYRETVSCSRRHFILSAEFNRISFSADVSNNGNIVLSSITSSSAASSIITLANTFTDASTTSVTKTINQVLDTTVNSGGAVSIIELGYDTVVGTAAAASGQFGCVVFYAQIIE